MILALACSLSSFAQVFPNSTIYVNNQGSPNTVSAYTVDGTSGALTQLPLSPAATGSNGVTGGSCRGLTRMVQSGSFVFVSNAGDQTITSFTIQPGGSLQSFPPPLPGPPPVPQAPLLFPTGLTLDGCQGISLAASPNGSYLFASSNGVINTYAINPANGTLSIPAAPAVSSVLNCCSPSAGMKAFSSGGADYLALSNLTSVSVYTINADGSLTAVAGSPFPQTGTGSITGLQASCSGNVLFGSETSTTSMVTDVWSVAGGVLSPVVGSPFTFNGAGSVSIALTPDNEFIFASNITSPGISSAGVLAGGTLTNNGRMSVSSFISAPEGMDVDSTGQFLFTADDGFGIAVQRLLGGGVLANIANTPITPPGQIQEVIANPGRTCATAGLTLTSTASPASVEIGAPVAYTVNLANAGPGASTVVVSNSLPASLTPGGLVGVVAAPAGEVRSGGTVTVTTALPHAIVVGEPVTINLSSDVSFNGTFNVTAVPTPTTFQYAQASADATAGGGTAATPACWFPGPTTGFCGGSFIPAVPFAISSISRNNATGVVTVTTAQPNHLYLGEAVTISAPGVTAQVANSVPNPNVSGAFIDVVSTVNEPSFNGVYSVASIIGPATFTYVQTGMTFPESALAAPAIPQAPPVVNAPLVPALDATTGGSATSPNVLPVTVNFTNLMPGAPETFILNATSSSSLAPGAIISNTVAIINKSAVNPAPAGDSATATVTVIPVSAANIGTALTASAVTASYGGNTNLSAHLTRTDNGTSLAGQTVSFTIDGLAAGSATTNSAGFAILNVNLGTTSVGTHAIVASFAAAGSFTASTSAPAVLTVTTAVLTVVPTPTSNVYGSPIPATLGFAYSGFVNGDTSAVVTGTPVCTVPATVTVTSPVGSYPITCAIAGLTATNYTFAAVPGTFTITPAPLTITADNQTRAFGAPDPVFTGTITGILNGDAITASYSTTATASSPVGTYPIVPSAVGAAAVLANYSITLVNGTLTVTPVVATNVPLTVTANNFSRLYGSPNPVFTASITGALNGDTFTVTFSTTATTASGVGAYPINIVTVTGANIANYVVTTVPGTLTINPAPLTAVANPATGVYGSAPAGLTASFTGLKNGDVLAATLATTATATSPVVPASPATSYPITITSITPAAVAANYAINTIAGAYTITPFPLTVTAPTFTRIYGGANPAIVLGGPTVADGITASVAAPGVSSPVGTYTSTAALSDPLNRLVNYSVTLLNGLATVTKAPLIANLTFAPAPVIVGSPAPTFSVASFATFVGADTALTAITGTLRCSVTTNNAGTAVPVTCSGLNAINYTITYAVPPSPLPVITVFFAGTGAGACKAGPSHTILAPLAGSPSLSKAANPTIPVSFRVCDSKGGTISSTVIANSVFDGVVTAGQTGFGFNSGTQSFTKTQSTAALAAGLHTGTINLIDGTSITYSFTLTLP
jgi:6-phosphogluconolactonase (cycloisomerase 2 family)